MYLAVVSLPLLTVFPFSTESRKDISLFLESSFTIPSPLSIIFGLLGSLIISDFLFFRFNYLNVDSHNLPRIVRQLPYLPTKCTLNPPSHSELPFVAHRN